MEYDPRRPLVSIHVPKCAGSSFRDVLQQWFGEALQFHYAHLNVDPREVWRRACAREGSCIHGHFHETGRLTVWRHYPEASQFITFVRDPLEVNLSFIHYARDRYHNRGVQVVPDDQLDHILTVDIDEWLASEGSMVVHSMPSRMDESNYRRMLDEMFVHVGVVEEMDASMAMLARTLDKPVVEMPVLNTTARKHPVSAWAAERFRARNRLAYLIWEYALERNRSVAPATERTDPTREPTTTRHAASPA